MEDVKDLIDLYLDLVRRHYGDRLVSVAIFRSIMGEAKSFNKLKVSFKSRKAL